MRHFSGSLIITFLGLSTAYLWGGIHALTITLMLCVLEISLSFDNAVINASILKKMDERWQNRFLTWGILISVFIVRFLLPVIIVVLATHLNTREIISLLINNPEEYAKHLEQTKASISSFGGIFLLLVFLSFIFDQKRDVHWLGTFEKKINALGKRPATKIITALFVLVVLERSAPDLERLEIIVAGSIGIILFSLLNRLTILLSQDITNIKTLSHAGLMQFIYLEVLDASFSLDGVIGAFAITKDIGTILIGLTIGAIFVRSMTLFLVHRGTLTKYRFLEHGAHYAIGALAIIMLLSTRIVISEIITGLIGVSFIGLSLISSILHNRRMQ